MGWFSGLCRRRGWDDPLYECRRGNEGFSCLVLVNGREYQTDLTYESGRLAQENAAMRAFMVCRNFSVNGGMLARNGVVQGLPASDNNGVLAMSTAGHRKSIRHSSTSHSQMWSYDVPHRHEHRGSSSSASSSEGGGDRF